jgi:hypothetical protein
MSGTECLANLEEVNQMKPCDVTDIPLDGDDKADKADKEEKGLTMRFRQTILYKKMVADILKLSPNANSFEIDTCIYWFVSFPDLFETKEGKSLIAGMDERVKHYTDPNYKEEDDDFVSRQYPLSKHQSDSVCDDTGVDSTRQGSPPRTTTATSTSTTTTTTKPNPQAEAGTSHI